MMELKGKYNTAIVYTDNINNETISQVIGLLNSPASAGSTIRIMPDTHAGAGCVVGTTMTLTDRVVPNLVGSDIGCGVFVVCLGKVDLDLPRFDDCVRLVPSGQTTYVSATSVRGRSNWKNQWTSSNLRLKNPEQWMAQLDCVKSLEDRDRITGSLGTLGGGNHFIELDRDEEGNTYMVIHSGSRLAGTQVAKIYQNIAVRECIDKGIKVPAELSYLEGESLEHYFHDMRLCQEFARENRRAMARQILEHYFPGRKFPVGDDTIGEYHCFESVHNYINFDDRVLRKGAISAHKGEEIIIPMNMRDGSLICEGLGNEDWNCSAPHGAGRMLARSQVKGKISLEEYRKAMEGIYTTCVNSSTLDESPMAYKPMDEIIRNMEGMNVRILKVIKPIYNFKASENAKE
ncbi:MAG: RtcB family protein [archaeon]|nr:RtcB family protein [archaeon]